MSHRAMNWALEQRELKPGPWVVLIKLADRHNKDTLRVDPEQSVLAHDCNMSRATLNRYLDELEASGLIHRVKRMNPATRKQLSTFYILGLDFENPPHVEFAVSQFETRADEGKTKNAGQSRVSDCDTENGNPVSQKTAIPCLKNGDSRVSNRDTNPVREPIREPIGGGGSAGAREAEPPTFRESVLAAMGVAADGVVGPSKIIGGQGDMAEAARWLAMSGMTEPAICDEIRRVMAAKRDGPASSFRYFTGAMQRLSAQLSAPPLQPVVNIEDARHDRPSACDRRQAAAADAHRQIYEAAIRNRRPSSADPFGG